jgi:hypothetical protein
MTLVKITALALVSILLVNFIAMEISDSYMLMLRSNFSSDVQLASESESLGKIYKTNVIRIPDDSLTEYYWHDNYVLVGSISKDIKDRNDFLLDLMLPFVDRHKCKNEIIIGQDTLSVLVILPKNQGEYKETIIVDIGHRKGIHIYGDDYSIEDSYAVASFLIYGSPQSYRTLSTVVYPQFEDADSLKMGI